MGVDGIGSGGGRPVRDVSGAEPIGATPVAAEGTRGAEGAPAATGPQGSAALEQLQRGEIDLDRYLDTRVDDALRTFQGRVPESQLEFVRQTLREQLATDPVLLELVRRTTGAVPASTE